MSPDFITILRRFHPASGILSARENGMAKSYRQNFGHWGEEKAAAFLSELGYDVLERNYRTGHSEVDLIACKDGCLSFVEVKTRSSRDFGLAEDAITPQKMAALERAVYAFLEAHPDLPQDWQIDLIVVETSTGELPPLILRYENLGEF